MAPTLFVTDLVRNPDCNYHRKGDEPVTLRSSRTSLLVPISWCEHPDSPVQEPDARAMNGVKLQCRGDCERCDIATKTPEKL